MKFDETSAYRARATHCSNQAGLTQDTILKKFWDDLADDWLALDGAMLASDNATIALAFVGQANGHRV